ncbi:hypothetical protein TNIN_348401 [Trichonephila inaurata madagascariensis]|uniref:Uncharacterized protein n=1 Tax=Trichonephila inaurata madagascariensis TaxID=2747483 RepID=A0A8X6YJ14_9ARAC|nr:hypothetical protein TNIN_348401 [Trichonephila inaurata madagascariensis]
MHGILPPRRPRKTRSTLREVRGNYNGHIHPHDKGHWEIRWEDFPLVNVVREQRRSGLQSEDFGSKEIGSMSRMLQMRRLLESKNP